MPMIFGNVNYKNWTGRWQPGQRQGTSESVAAILPIESLLANVSVVPTIAGVYQGADGAAGTTHTVTWPSNILPGDRLVIFVNRRVTAVVATFPAGWTYITPGGSEADYSILYYDCVGDGSETGTFNFTTATSSGPLSWGIIQYRGADRTVAPQYGTVAGNNPPSLSPTWGSGVPTAYVAYAEQTSASTAVISAYPTGYINQTAMLGSTATQGWFATKEDRAGSGTEDPSTFSFSVANATNSITLAVRGLTVTNAANPPVFTNAPSYLSPKLVVTLKPGVFTNSQTFPSSTVSVASATKQPPLFTNTQTFPSAKIIETLKPGVFTNSQTFNVPKIVTTLKPGAFTNASSYLSPKLIVTLKPGLLTNTQTFNSPKIIRTLKPSVFTNTQTINASKIVVTLKPGVLTNSNTFLSPKLIDVLKPGLYTNSNTFLFPKLVETINPGVFTNAQSIFAPTVSVAGASKQPALFTNSQTFLSPKLVITLKPTAHSNTSTLFATKLIEVLKPGLLTNAQVFQSPKLIVTLKPGVYTNTQTFPSPTVSVSSSTIMPSRHVNVSTFPGPTVSVKSTAFVNSGYGGIVGATKRRSYDPDANRREALRRVRELFYRDLTVSTFVNNSRIYAPGVIITPHVEEADDFGLSPVELDEVLDILDAIEAIDAMEAISALEDTQQ